MVEFAKYFKNKSENGAIVLREEFKAKHLFKIHVVYNHKNLLSLVFHWLYPCTVLVATCGDEDCLQFISLIAQVSDVQCANYTLP